MLTEKKQRYTDLLEIFIQLDVDMKVLKEKDDAIGKVEGDPATVREKETSIEVVVILLCFT